MPKLEEINFNQAHFVVSNLKEEPAGAQGDECYVNTFSHTFAGADLSNLETIDLRNIIVALNKFVYENQKVTPLTSSFNGAKLTKLTKIYFPNAS
jgi:hypothetical protein